MRGCPAGCSALRPGWRGRPRSSSWSRSCGEDARPPATPRDGGGADMRLLRAAAAGHRGARARRHPRGVRVPALRPVDGSAHRPPVVSGRSVEEESANDVAQHQHAGELQHTHRANSQRHSRTRSTSSGPAIRWRVRPGRRAAARRSSAAAGSRRGPGRRRAAGGRSPATVPAAARALPACRPVTSSITCLASPARARRPWGPPQPGADPPGSGVPGPPVVHPLTGERPHRGLHPVPRYGLTVRA